MKKTKKINTLLGMFSHVYMSGDVKMIPHENFLHPKNYKDRVSTSIFLLLEVYLDQHEQPEVVG